MLDFNYLERPLLVSLYFDSKLTDLAGNLILLSFLYPGLFCRIGPYLLLRFSVNLILS
jgi:hypothetical protein